MSVLKIKDQNENWQDITTIKGQDGFSPSASVSQSGDITTITITDKNGTTTATINLSNYATTQYVDNIVGNINTILATLTTPNINGGN